MPGVNEQKILQTTLTGEPVQPIRLYYEVRDKEPLIRCLHRLRCMDFDPKEERWVWLYEHEARTLEFRTPYASIPRQNRPVVIGSFFLKGSKAFLDLRSFDRALRAIPFFHEHVGPDAARITHAAVVNRLFEAREQVPSNLDSFFFSHEMVERRPEESIEDFKSSIQRRRAEGEGDLRSVVEERAKVALPEIEKFPVHFYEDGINSLKAVLRMREVVAFEHWKGNVDYTLYDVLKTMIPGL
jgi:hypothetical protein